LYILGGWFRVSSHDCSGLIGISQPGRKYKQSNGKNKGWKDKPLGSHVFKIKPSVLFVNMGDRIGSALSYVDVDKNEDIP
jgi:hypothetical protein